MEPAGSADFVIAVDAPIDLRDWQSVLFHWCANTDPGRDLHVERRAQGAGTSARIGFDATRKLPGAGAAAGAGAGGTEGTGSRFATIPPSSLWMTRPSAASLSGPRSSDWPNLDPASRKDASSSVERSVPCSHAMVS
jgi:3-polyprenyl-4-hydroxybenzoate decarboxylase